MSSVSGMECTHCGMPLKDAVWLLREPYCNGDCLMAERLFRELQGASRTAGRRRDHNLCGAVPCSHCQ